jgi:hypothetical protein
VAELETLTPGTYLTVDHAALDTPEMRAIHHPGYENVARAAPPSSNAGPTPSCSRPSSASESRSPGTTSVSPPRRQSLPLPRSIRFSLPTRRCGYFISAKLRPTFAKPSWVLLPCRLLVGHDRRPPKANSSNGFHHPVGRHPAAEDPFEDVLRVQRLESEGNRELGKNPLQIDRRFGKLTNGCTSSTLECTRTRQSAGKVDSL